MPDRCDEALIVLASRSQESYLLVNALAGRFTVERIIFERPRRWRMLRHRLRRLGFRATLGQLAFLLWDRLVIRPRSRPAIARLLADHDVRPPDGRIPATDVSSINGPQVAELLDTLRPCVVVVSGTGIIAPRLLASGDTFLNIHCGITPRYRGVHGGFWAVYDGRADLAGVTVHKLDAGVDTGPIVEQAPIAIDSDADTYRTLPIKQYLAGLPLMIEAVEATLAGELRSYQPDDLHSKQWYSPTLAQYLQFVRRLRQLPSPG